MNEHIIFKTRLPYSYYFWICINLVVFIFIFWNNSFVQILIYQLIFSLVSYLLVCRYACTLLLFDSKIVIKYYFPYPSKIEIPYIKTDVIRYELGYYYYFNTEHSLSRIEFFYPYDIIYFHKDKAKSSLYNRLNLNVNYFDFKKLQKHIEEKLTVVKSYED